MDTISGGLDSLTKFVLKSFSWMERGEIIGRAASQRAKFGGQF